MAKIQPIKFPLNEGTATELTVLILGLPLIQFFNKIKEENEKTND